MPQYKVIAPGFYGGVYYKPDGKRPVLHTDEPFKKDNLPSWLAEMPKETSAEKKNRVAAEKAQAKADKQKAKADKQEIDNASTTGDGAEASFLGSAKAANNTVETL